MKVSVSIDAVPHEFVEALDTLNIAKKRTKTFLGRYDIEQFVEKAVANDASALHYLVDDSSIGSTQTEFICKHLADRIEQNTLLVQLAPGGSGAPSAPSRPAQPGSNPTEGISDLYSNEMKQFIASHRDSSAKHGGIRQYDLGSSTAGRLVGKTQKDPVAKGTHPQSDYEKPSHETPTHYKITIEVAGRNPCRKQKVEISGLAKGPGASPGEQAQANSAAHHTRDKHRSVIEYRKIPNTPRDIVLTVPTKGYGPNIHLPLLSGVTPSNINTEKDEWDNVLVPVKPLAYVTKSKAQQEADILKPGWLYIFWRGKLWRELEAQKNQAFRDVSVAYCRQTTNNIFNETEGREARGHWLSAVWIPYKLNGEYQTGTNAPRLAYSSVQWDWAYIEALEQSSDKMQKETTSLDLSCYSNDRHFKNASGDTGSIETALLNQLIDSEATGYEIVSEKGKQLRSMRDSHIPVVFLPTARDKLLVCLKDKRGRVQRNKTLTFELGNRTVTRTTNHTGVIEIPVEENEPLNGELRITNNETTTCQGNFKTGIDELAAISTVEGQQARLNNLGFDAGVVDGINGKKTKNALKGFQSTHSLDVDGIYGPKSQQKLKSVYQQ